MRALRFETTGGLDKLAVVEQPRPVPGPREVLVRIEAGALNKSDLSNVGGRFPYTTVPRTPGRDFSGVVVEGPPELVGKAVFGTGREIGFTRDGTHAEYIAVPAEGVVIKPSALSHAQAASCGVPFLTALPMLDQCQVRRGTKLIVIGAAGGVGIATIHLARRRGAEVLAAVRRPAQAAGLKARGFATLLLDESRPLADQVRTHFPDGADVVFDTAGPWLGQSIAALGRYGRTAVIVVPPADGHLNLPIRDLYRRGGSIVGVNSLLYSAAESATMLNAVVGGFDDGSLIAPDDIRAFPLECAIDAYHALAAGEFGKFVVEPSHRPESP